MSEINKIIYRILKNLRDSMSADEFDEQRIAPERLGTDKNTRDAILVQLLHAGYIEGLQETQYIGDTKPTLTDLQYTKITLAGLEYLEENSLMQKAARLAKGIVEVIK